MDYIVIFVTTPDEYIASDIAKTLVEERFAGCVNIIKSVRSIYTWEGDIEDDTEALMIIKTKKGMFKRIETRIKELHPYTVPEIIAFPIIDGSKEYIEWLKSVVY